MQRITKKRLDKSNKSVPQRKAPSVTAQTHWPVSLRITLTTMCVCVSVVVVCVCVFLVRMCKNGDLAKIYLSKNIQSRGIEGKIKE